MSLYNIKLDTSFDIPKATWNTGNYRDNLQINNNSFYDIQIIQHTGGNHIQIIDEILEPAPYSVDRFPSQSVIDSSILPNKSNDQTLADPLANFTYSYYEKISLAKYWKPIKN